MRSLAERVLDDLSACGFEPDDQGAVASSALFARSIGDWEAAARAWVEHPDRDRGVMLLSVVVESDPVWGATTAAERIAAAFAHGPHRDLMLRRLAAAALLERPPTGFFGQLVLHSSGERRRRARHQEARAPADRDARPLERARRRGGAPRPPARGSSPRARRACSAPRTPRCCTTPTS